MRKRFTALFMAVACLYSLMATPVFAFGYQPNTSVTRTVNSVTPIRHEFGDWQRQTVPCTAGQAGESAGYAKVDKVSITVTSSIGIEIPIESVALSLGVETTVLEEHESTVMAPLARALRAGESAACYCRQHWIVYNVDYTVTTVTCKSSIFGGIKRQISTERFCKEIKVGQDLNATVDENGEYSDCHWFYATSGHGAALTQTIKSNACGEETYQVYLNYCSA